MNRYTIASLQKAYAEKSLSPVEVLREHLERIDRLDGALGATLERFPNLEQSAREAEKKWQTGTQGPLTGIPIAVKDNICTEGTATTCASKMLENFVPPYSATAVEKLQQADALLLCKTNMDEFAMGGSGETSYFGPTRNPYNPERVTGGSSSGSAAAVSAGLCPAALGSDTGGSIRQPAAFCGVTGLKPTYGTVSRYGLVAFASSLDTIGPIANTARDCATLYNAICGSDPRDGTTVPGQHPDAASQFGRSLKGVRLAILPQLMGEGTNPQVTAAVEQAVGFYKEAGAEVVPFHLTDLDKAVAAYYLIASAEASSNLSRYDGVKYGHRAKAYQSLEELLLKSRTEGFGREVKRRILLGTYALSSGYYDDYYQKAVAVKERLTKELSDILSQCEAVLSPTAPTTAYPVGKQIEDPVAMYKADVCTVLANLAGLPAVSTPCGYDSEGMPIGLSLTGPRFSEAAILALADAFEGDFTRREPALEEVAQCLSR